MSRLSLHHSIIWKRKDWVLLIKARKLYSIYFLSTVSRTTSNVVFNDVYHATETLVLSGLRDWQSKTKNKIEIIAPAPQHAKEIKKNEHTSKEMEREFWWQLMKAFIFFIFPSLFHHLFSSLTSLTWIWATCS